LISNSGRLLLADGARQKQSRRLSSGRRNNNPSLFLLLNVEIFDQIEAERLGKKVMASS
jgi:hypothetical protein